MNTGFLRLFFFLTIYILVADLVAEKISDNENEDRQSPLPPIVPCSTSYPYRTFDGTCNNLNNPRYGQSNTIFQRLTRPHYFDGRTAVRRSITGAPLPSPRLISTTITINESVSTYEATLLTMQFGQFLDHDLTQTPVAVSSTGETITCCSSGSQTGATIASPLHAECLPISIPTNDPVFKSVTCMDFVRSRVGLFLNGNIPPNREQLNAVTHWIDASQIYGNNNVDARNLRDTSSGKGLLKVLVQQGRSLLPLTNTCCPGDPTNSCAAAHSCFFAGDSRVTEQPLLTLMHILWVREHNRVANKLFQKFGTARTDEFYYQEARRIVIAEFQHITYQEYLRVLIGPIIDEPSPPIGPSDPAIFTEFSTAAFRMGHSQIRSLFQLYESDGSTSSQSYFLSDAFANAGARVLSPKFIDNALRGLTRTPVQSVDRCFADDITSQLFKRPGSRVGLDLISLNIQRGRDHGLVPYAPMFVAAQQYVLNRGISIDTLGFDTLNLVTNQETIAAFKKIYSSVHDIDLFIGGVTENPIIYGPLPFDRTLVGPTFIEIIRRQFENLKRSDRFFYSDLSKPTSLTWNQFNEIRKVSMARIICDNNDGTINMIQPNAFRPPTGQNSPMPCNAIPGIDFNNYF